ncbi:MAG: phosphoribosyltransferase [Rhodospirillales bacterium]|nr:MAG: phosphoribosyltransferase [Rhodospirillales bacterium]
MLPFTDRCEAGRLLAARLGEFADLQPYVMALPRGGVPVGFEVAKALTAPLDVVFVRKIGAPGNPELALAAVVDGDTPELVVNPEVAAATGAGADYLAQVEAAELRTIAARHRLYQTGRRSGEIAGRTVIVVDDGIATGSTMRAALKALRRQRPGRLVVAVPVAPPDTLADLRAEVDAVVCLASPEPFIAIGGFYQDFRQVTDGEVVDLLRRAASWSGSGSNP